MAKNQYMPDEVSPPGETLLEVLEQRGMSQADLSERIGRPRKTINEIIKGKAAITPQTALQLERALGVPASFWNARESRYREFLARQDEQQRLATQIEWVDNFPVREMVRQGLIRRRADKVELLEELLSFFGIASPDQWKAVWEGVAFRKARKSDKYALSAWLRTGQIVAEQATCNDYDAAKFRETLRWIRRLTVLPPREFQEQLEATCAACGVVVVFVKELPRSGASGATFWIGQSRAVMQLSLRYKTDDQLWFTFFHEAAHILLHGRRDVFIEGLDEEDQREAEANRAAADFLIPPMSLQVFLATHRRPFSREAVRRLAQDVGVAPGIVVGRLQHDKYLAHSHLNGLKRTLQWAPD